MFLLKILKRSNITKNQTSSICKRIHKINFLTLIKKKKVVKNLNTVLIALFSQKIKLLNFCAYSKLHHNIKIPQKLNNSLNKMIDFNNFSNKVRSQSIEYIIHINLTYTNTFINVTDIKGDVKISYSAGVVDLKNKQKVKQPIALITLLKHLSPNLKFLDNSILALHFKNTKTNYESFIIKMLRKRFFIKIIKSHNLRPHNGCRPRKLKRIKNKKINFAKTKK